CLQGYSAPYSF
nr:immunoglobulin light chain junction region [Macaca mulatta]MPN91253.1 immunoglobulin light chain junction region [Macaca mulatta]MPN91574.1 immunoglobulin light chain junction region [Macaca mulatta]MPN91580.1 immunoglobulin light chain junction region [Macaca mulatta]MPN91616.1 immunoglobulin light chain junction region [Macaca mulatta]